MNKTNITLSPRTLSIQGWLRPELTPVKSNCDYSRFKEELDLIGSNLRDGRQRGLVRATGTRRTGEPVDATVCLMDSTCLEADIHFPVDWMLLKDVALTLLKAVGLIRKEGLLCRMPGGPEELGTQMNRLCIEMTHSGRKKDGKKLREKNPRRMKSFWGASANTPEGTGTSLPRSTRKQGSAAGHPHEQPERPRLPGEGL